MTSLHDRLADLAEDAPVGGPTPDLWATGVRRGRRVRAAALGATAVVLVVVAGVGAWLVDRPQSSVTPADVPFGELHLPRTIDVPSPWADGTGDVGPPGPLAAVATAPRNRTDGLWDVVEGVAPYGVSAVDGSVAFLDLPGTDYSSLGGYGLVLSPDGTKVGYVRYVQRQGAAKVAGLAVYDTLTGRTRLLEDPQSPDLRGVEDTEISFSGDSRFLQTSYSRSGSNAPREHELVVWDVDTGELLVAEGPGAYWRPNLGSTPSGVVWSRNRATFRFDPSTGETTSEQSAFRVVEASYGPEEGAFAAIAFGESDRGPWRLFVGSSPGAARQVEVDFDPDDLIGWRDPDHVVLRELPSGEVHVVDLRTGEAVREQMSSASNLMLPSLAADLWANDLVDAAPPPEAGDPRRPWWWAGGSVAVLAVLLVFFVRRRRVSA